MPSASFIAGLNVTLQLSVVCMYVCMYAEVPMASCFYLFYRASLVMKTVVLRIQMYLVYF